MQADAEHLTHSGEDLIAACVAANSGNLVLQHTGLISPADVMRLRECTQLAIEASGLPTIWARRVASSVVELADNISNHGAGVATVRGSRAGGIGAIRVQRQNTPIGIHVAAANRVDPQTGHKVVERVETIAAMSHDERRKLYRERARSRTDNESHGAGLGLLHISRAEGAAIDARLDTTDDNPILLLHVTFPL